MTKIKPCPCCNDSWLYVSDGGYTSGYESRGYKVNCKCGYAWKAVTWQKTEEAAIEEWNKTVRRKKIKTVEKKILCAYFQYVKDGIKKFEIRKDEDNIQPGDKVILKEYTGTEYTGREVKVKVDYVLRSVQGLQDGYCIWSISLIG